VPQKDAHLSQAAHNFAFYNSVDCSRYSDWAATALFYTALHYIDAYLATRSIDPGSHDTRDKCITRISVLRPLYKHYSHLKNHSRTARYYPPASFSMTAIKSLESIHLNNIKIALAPHLT
jgi:hypothetical protein